MTLVLALGLVGCSKDSGVDDDGRLVEPDRAGCTLESTLDLDMDGTPDSSSMTEYDMRGRVVEISAEVVGEYAWARSYWWDDDGDCSGGYDMEVLHDFGVVEEHHLAVGCDDFDLYDSYLFTRVATDGSFELLNERTESIYERQYGVGGLPESDLETRSVNGATSVVERRFEWDSADRLQTTHMNFQGSADVWSSHLTWFDQDTLASEELRDPDGAIYSGEYLTHDRHGRVLEHSVLEPDAPSLVNRNTWEEDRWAIVSDEEEVAGQIWWRAIWMCGDEDPWLHCTIEVDGADDGSAPVDGVIDAITTYTYTCP